MINEKPPNSLPYQTIHRPKSNIILLCDHSSSYIPVKYSNLGLSESLLNKHIAYDIGAYGLTHSMASLLGANAIFSYFSRLLIDPNRGIDDPTLIMKFADQHIIPGNRSIDKSEFNKRKRNFYVPYHNQIEIMINNIIQRGFVPVIISMHSFTRIFRNNIRPWEVSILWDKDNRVSEPLINLLENDNKYKIGDNEPYIGYLRGDTLNKHATTQGIPHALIEVRNDLINNHKKQNQIALYLSEKLQKVLDINRSEINKIKKFGTKSI
jgi:predicted N-formylglutamate amidohydrolase